MQGPLRTLHCRLQWTVCTNGYSTNLQLISATAALPIERGDEDLRVLTITYLLIVPRHLALISRLTCSYCTSHVPPPLDRQKKQCPV